MTLGVHGRVAGAGFVLALVTALALGGGSPFGWERGSGYFALTLLLLSLACTPAMRLARMQSAPLAVAILRSRRTLGLSAAAAATLHALLAGGIYFGTDAIGAALDAAMDIPWILHGVLALAILSILAVTSIRPIARRLRAWAGLHRLVYLAAILTCTHALLGPHPSAAPLMALGLVLVLLAARLAPRPRATPTL